MIKLREINIKIFILFNPLYSRKTNFYDIFCNLVLSDPTEGFYFNLRENVKCSFIIELSSYKTTGNKLV